MANRFLTSITRVSDLAERPFEVRSLARGEWATGDYVVCEVTGRPGPLYRVELVTGRRTPVLPGDILVGAFGKRAATLECVGDWRDIGDDMILHQLTGAGLFGKVTSNSAWVNRPMQLLYCGHAMRAQGKVNIADFIAAEDGSAFAMPVLLVAGTSMSAGKTLTGRALVDCAKRLGYRVAAAKLTGAAGYKDALSYGDAGADTIFDYVDAGLVSTVCTEAEFKAGFETLLAQIARSGADLLVGEIGASPLEPYNGMAAMRRLADHIVLYAMCASDAYAALGLCEAAGRRPDFVTGPAANNTASAALVRELTGVPALDLGDAKGMQALQQMLRARLPAAGGSGSIKSGMNRKKRARAR